MPDTPTSPFPEIQVVLVEPGNSINIGAVARAMSNFGQGNLCLVAPPRFDLSQALRSACQGGHLLHQARITPSLAEAVKTAQEVVGFTARMGAYRPRHHWLTQWSQTLRHSPCRQISLLFGPEDHGLSHEHLRYCHRLVRIPASEENPSFNLAQAVLLALYQISLEKASSSSQNPAAGAPPLAIPPAAPKKATPPSSPRARMEAIEPLHEALHEILTWSGFFHKGTPRPIPGTLRNILQRIEPSERELRIVLGVLHKIRKKIRSLPALPESPDSPRPR